jgi:NAD+ diphosphatase
MIAAVSSRCGERILLARSKRHPVKFYTVLAGFVEAGETFEAAVAREAFEETGIRIDEGSATYVGSQPWPFPQSCMIGFLATADDTAPLNVDTVELLDARWFDKNDVAKAALVEGATMQPAVAEAALKKDPSLPLLIPPQGVIARKLIDRWLAGRK